MLQGQAVGSDGWQMYFGPNQDYTDDVFMLRDSANGNQQLVIDNTTRQFLINPVTFSGNPYTLVVSNISANINIAAITRSSNFTTKAFSTYTTNLFGGRIYVTLTTTLTPTASAGASIGVYRFTSAGVAINPPILDSLPIGVSIDTAASKNMEFFLGPGEYFGITNITGTATYATNQVDQL
jgi:hypothetical protein